MRYNVTYLIKSLIVCSLFAWSAIANAQQTWTVNFNDSDIQEVIKFVADASGRTLILDPRVKGRVKVISSKPLNAGELYDLFLSVLEVHGFTAIEVGNVTRIVPRKDARSSPVKVSDSKKNGAINEYITQVIQLDNVAAVKVLPVLRPLVPQHAHLAAYDPSNAIIVSDTAANIKRIRELIERIDKAAVATTEVIPLHHAQAEEVVRILTQLERNDGGKKGGGTSKLVLVADKRTNGVLVSGDDLQRERAKELIARLDKPREQAGNVRVVYLKYADAAQVSEVLSKVVQNMGKVGNNEKGGGSNSQATVEADEETNALLITADVGVLPILLDVVDKLDIRRAQVLVEAIVVELEGGQDNALGIQWLFQSDSGGVGGSSLADGILSNVAGGILGTETTNRFDEDGNLIESTQTSNAAQLGASIAGNRGQLFGVGKMTSNTNFLLLLNALEQKTGSNILSTPNLLTTDNHEAKITVGQNVPFVTGSFSSTGSTSSPQNPFQTIERQNVGITLQVTPHINEGDTVVLDLVQEISSLTGATVQASDVITNERKIETQIMARDGEIVVLGGLIQDDVQESEQRVPFLGSIPGIGRLFRSDSTTVTKRNLLVFIRPTIIRDDEALEGATAEKYRYIRQQQENRRKRGARLVKDKSVLPLLPEWPGDAKQSDPETGASSDDVQNTDDSDQQSNNAESGS